MAQGDFFGNLNAAMNTLNAAKKQGVITAQQEEEHINNMLSMYDAINAKKAAGREWDLKTQTVWGNMKRFAKEMTEDAENLKKAKKEIKQSQVLKRELETQMTDKITKPTREKRAVKKPVKLDL